jgi:tetratricopeptide (TPR) repeat protein
MKKFYIVIILIALWQVGCGTEANSNGTNANNANQPINEDVTNTNEQNTYVNSNANADEEDEEVPKFEDAKEALQKGTDYLDKIKIDKAIDALKQATELDADLPDAHFQLGVAYALKERAEDAKVKPADTEESPPAKKSKKAKKEEKRNSIKSFENAVKAYKKFIGKNPKDAEANFNLGRAYNKLGSDSDDDARKALEQAVKLDDENSLYRTELGAVLIELAKYPEAIKQLNKAIELDEDNIEAEDLLEKAKAGKKRTDFNKDKQ